MKLPHVEYTLSVLLTAAVVIRMIVHSCVSIVTEVGVGTS